MVWPQKVGVLIPAYESEASLRQWLPELLKSAPAACVCVVDDGSRDKTAESCRQLGVSLLSHDVNLGKGAALKTGFAYFVKNGFDWVITMDADGQHAVGDLPKFLREIRRKPGIGLCIGWRSLSMNKMPLARIISNTLTSLVLTLLTGKPIRDSQCGYRVYAARLLQSVTLVHQRFELESEVILKASYLHFPVSFVKVQTLYCSTESHISHLLDTLRWIKAIIAIWIRLDKTPL
jgi:glycosyltransferase involved in cell wall biosynthesis